MKRITILMFTAMLVLMLTNCTKETINWTTGEQWGYAGVFTVAYNGSNNWTITDVTPSTTSITSATPKLPARTLDMR